MVRGLIDQLMPVSVLDLAILVSIKTNQRLNCPFQNHQLLIGYVM